MINAWWLSLIILVSFILCFILSAQFDGSFDDEN
jgi:hypothetical protein